MQVYNDPAQQPNCSQVSSAGCEEQKGVSESNQDEHASCAVAESSISTQTAESSFSENLLNDSLLQLYRTGANRFVFNPSDERDDYDVSFEPLYLIHNVPYMYNYIYRCHFFVMQTSML